MILGDFFVLMLVMLGSIVMTPGTAYDDHGLGAGLLSGLHQCHWSFIPGLSCAVMPCVLRPVCMYWDCALGSVTGSSTVISYNTCSEIDDFPGLLFMTRELQY